jgi:hypothetical protein
MISTAHMALLLWPAVFDGTSSRLECTLQRTQPVATVTFSGDVGVDGDLHTNLLKKIGDDRALVGTLQSHTGKEDPKRRLVFASGPSNRFIWSFGSRPRGYSMELTDFPASGVAHFLLTETGVSGGRHAFDRLVGFGTCKIALGPKGSTAQ